MIISDDIDILNLHYKSKLSYRKGVHMKSIDCFGDICPVPLLKMQNQLDLIASGDSFMMVVDHSCVIESMKEYLKKSQFSYEVDEVMNGVWEITITKP